MKLQFKLPFIIPSNNFSSIFKSSLKGRYSFASNIRVGETIFKNVCASCYVRGGLVVSKG